MSVGNNNAEERVSSILDEIRQDCFITEQVATTICQFFYFCINQKDSSKMLPYNLLIEYDNKDSAMRLAKKLALAAKGLMDAVACEQCTEKDFIDNAARVYHLDRRVVFLVEDMLKETPDNWEAAFTELKKRPEIVKIYLRDRNETIDRFEKDTYFRWCFLNLHIEKTAMTEQELKKFFFSSLDRKGKAYTKRFKEEIEKEIDIVYSKAQLREENFIFDLLDRTENRAMEKAVVKTEYDIEDVPLYRETPFVGKEEPEDPVDTESIEVKPDKHNLLVLALSTRNLKGERNSSFTLNDGSGLTINKCYYQLEPIAKYMIQQHKGERITILEMCTSDTLKDIEIGEKYPKDNRSAKTYFEFRIDQYSKLYRCDVDYRQVNIDEGNMSEGLVATAESLKKIWPEIKGKGEFWIDTHGGFRDVTIMCNSLISLLKTYDIKPDKIYGVRYRNVNVGLEDNKIVDQMESFTINDFVAGMNEFIEYGSASILNSYYESSNSKKNDKINSIVDAMKTVSDGTKMCDPKVYLKGLDKLAEAVQEYGNGTNEIFDIFVDYINKDYGALLTKKRRNIDVIERCKNKKMYQQALTFIESLMPKEFSQKGVLYYDHRDNEDVKTMVRYSGKAYMQDEPEHYLFDSYLVPLKYFEKSYNTDTKDQMAIKAINANIEDLIDNFTIKNNIVEINTDSKNNKIILGQVECFTNLKKADSLKKAGQLLRLHKALKECRNMTNHASGKDRPTKEDIEAGIDKYIYWVKELFKDGDLNSPKLTKTGKTKLSEYTKKKIAEKNNKSSVGNVQ